MPQPAPKILVQGASGDYYLISKDTVPQKVSSSDPNILPYDADLVNAVADAENALATHFASPPNGVKIGITTLEDF